MSSDTGMRFTWGAYPNTAPKKHDANPSGQFPLPDMIVPLACMFTPLQPVPGLKVVSGVPVRCRNCGTVLSPQASCDVVGGFWTCPSCLSRSQLPTPFDPSHASLTDTVVEYSLGVDPAAVPSFLFVVDTCLDPEELEAIKKNLLRCLEWLPQQSLVGLITFGHGVTLWEIGFGDCSRCYALRGRKSYSTDELVNLLGISAATPVRGRFLVPLQDAEFSLSTIIQELNVDPFPVAPGERPARATGVAMEVAALLTEQKLGSGGGRTMLFLGGPCTRGPGAAAATSKAIMMRSHRDLFEGNAPFVKPATEYFDLLAARFAKVSFCVDVIAQSYDQTGMLEMRACVNHTGGVFLAGDQFDHRIFVESFYRLLVRGERTFQGTSVTTASNVAVTLQTSKDTLICGAIGPGITGEGGKRSISPIAVGHAGTNTWQLGGCDQSLTLTVIFDTETADSASNVAQSRFFQFATTYVTPLGERRLRVSSASQPIAQTVEASFFVNNACFDQACAAAVVAKLTVAALEKQENRFESTRRWIDRLLVLFVRKFGSYRVGDAESLKLAPTLSLFPVFLFNLRRSEFFMTINISPDETTCKRHFLLRESCDNCLLMIQPTLFAYSLQNPEPTPKVLDSSSVQPDQILFMDAFFNIHVLMGSTIHEWKKAGYHEKPEYAHFKALIERPVADAHEVLRTRFPFPRFSITDQYGSEARHILTRLNPSTTHTSGVADSRALGPGHQGQIQEVMYTDDASIARFMQTLKAAAVSGDIEK